MHFANFGLELGVVFEGKNAVQARISRFNSKLKNKKQKELFANSLT